MPQKASLKLKGMKSVPPKKPPTSLNSEILTNELNDDCESQMEHYKKGENSSTLISQTIEKIEDNVEKERFDKWGNKICFDGKQKISFKTPIRSIIQVENWKDLNAIEKNNFICNRCQIC